MTNNAAVSPLDEMSLEQAAEHLGHRLVRDSDGSIDMFQVDIGFHNGPRCELCDEEWCEHCTKHSDITPCRAAAIAAFGEVG